jgi:hypothetical protein
MPSQRKFYIGSDQSLFSQHQDVPANASDLGSAEEISLELDRERLRFVQEERKNFRFLRAGFIAVLAILALAAAVSAVTILVGLTAGPAEAVIPSIWALAGSGGGSVFIWRFYAGRMPTRGTPA